MSAQRGKDLLLKISDPNAPGTFRSVVGLRARSISFNSQTVDVTHAQSTDGWRELLAGAGVRQAALSGSGVFLNDETANLVRSTFFAGAIQRWQVIFPQSGIVEGPFQITNLDYAGDFDGELTMAMALESAGAIAFTPEGGSQ
ncbi:MAG: phage major tail protein, TP901-1 family [Pseudomonadota bacterium]